MIALEQRAQLVGSLLHDRGSPPVLNRTIGHTVVLDNYAQRISLMFNVNAHRAGLGMTKT